MLLFIVQLFVLFSIFDFVSNFLLQILPFQNLSDERTSESNSLNVENVEQRELEEVRNPDTVSCTLCGSLDVNTQCWLCNYGQF